MSRLLVISNRVAAVSESGPAAGGLAIGVLDALRETGGLWFGWNGECHAQGGAEPHIETHGNVTYATISLAKRDYDQYYRGFSNATLWPTFHYRNDLSRYDREEYAGYWRVNRWLAEKLKPLIQPDDILWVHDYHLLPFAQACREIGIENPIGFFLHIPFPTPQVMFTVPPHAELVKAMAVYDLIGFQTRSDVESFVDYIVREAHGRYDGESIEVAGHRARVGAFPIGVYPDAIAKAAQACSDRKPVKSLRASLRDRALILSVDRLDYSKGIYQRFQAFEKLLQGSPGLHGRVKLFQIAPPTRSDVQTYQRIRHQLEGESGRINGRFAQLDWTPINYLNRKYERNLLMALLRVARVGYVTPLRDGMNLVAKEFVAAQDPEDPGVLVLSQFAGAVEDMRGALVVNPFNTHQMAEALERALSMAREERIERHATMMAALRRNDLSTWRDSFMTALRAAAAYKRRQGAPRRGRRNDT